MDETEDHGPLLRVIAGRIHPREPATTRTEKMRQAKARGTHTADEWHALVRATPTCRYCGVRLNVFNRVSDHRIPVGRGGSDAIDNIDAVCWQCNLEKALRTPEEWSYEGPTPRPFAPMPSKRREWERLCS